MNYSSCIMNIIANFSGAFLKLVSLFVEKPKGLYLIGYTYNTCYLLQMCLTNLNNIETMTIFHLL